MLGTGSYARSLPGLEIGGRVITSDQALTLDWIPRSAIILGGGVIGSEFASVWKSFGTDVTIVEALPHLVPNEDEAISKAFERAFRKRGIGFNLGVRFQGVTQDDNGVHVTLEDGKTFDADVLLVAVGRGPPSTSGLGYEEQGLTLDRGFVITNERLHTGVANIYAVGDIVPPGLQLAHRGFQQGIFVAEEIAGLNPPDDRRVRHPARDVLRPPRSGRSASRRSAPRSCTATRTSRSSSTTSAATARARSSRRRASSSSSARRTGRSSACT